MEIAPERVAVHVVISGHVQGVWYRGWTVAEASRRGLDGWVRNRSTDGTVEAVIAGDPAAVNALIKACRRGPPAARVVALAVNPVTDPGPCGFSQRETV